MKATKAKSHYTKNAAEGKTARIKCKLDLRHIPPEDLSRLGLPAIELTIEGGTLTPDQAKRVYEALLGSAGVPT
jgi:hypothetical protein